MPSRKILTGAKDSDDYEILSNGFSNAYLNQDGVNLLKEQPALSEALRTFFMRGDGMAEAVKSLAMGLDELAEVWLERQAALDLSVAERQKALELLKQTVPIRVVADNLPDMPVIRRLDKLSVAAGQERISRQYLNEARKREMENRQSFASQISEGRSIG